MNKIVVGFVTVLIVATFFKNAEAQKGWTAPIHQTSDSLDGNMPPINQPQAGWSPVLDLKMSDGTVALPSCADPKVVATVKDGVLNSLNPPGSFPSGQQLVTQAKLSTVWVHPTTSGREVCDMRVSVNLPFTGAEEWEFQTYANDGQVMVFFYDKDDQSGD